MPPTPPWDIRERSFLVSCRIVKFCSRLGRERDCRRIADQLLDAGTSVGANAEEAKGAYSRREFAVKNCYSLKESRESVFLIIACELTKDPEAELLLKEAKELLGIFNATVRSARRRPDA
jgi:four helix bundle protein